MRCRYLSTPEAHLTCLESRALTVAACATLATRANAAYSSCGATAGGVAVRAHAAPRAASPRPLCPWRAVRACRRDDARGCRRGRARAGAKRPPARRARRRRPQRRRRGRAARCRCHRRRLPARRRRWTGVLRSLWASCSRAHSLSKARQRVRGAARQVVGGGGGDRRRPCSWSPRAAAAIVAAAVPRTRAGLASTPDAVGVRTPICRPIHSQFVCVRARARVPGAALSRRCRRRRPLTPLRS